MGGGGYYHYYGTIPLLVKFLFLINALRSTPFFLITLFLQDDKTLSAFYVRAEFYK
jgi:hypothetical protein